jgi:hypothetical protein
MLIFCCCYNNKLRDCERIAVMSQILPEIKR